MTSRAYLLTFDVYASVERRKIKNLSRLISIEFESEKEIPGLITSYLLEEKRKVQSMYPKETINLQNMKMIIL